MDKPMSIGEQVANDFPQNHGAKSWAIADIPNINESAMIIETVKE